MMAFTDLPVFVTLYPETVGKMHHALIGHPMFELDALVALATRMRPVDVEYNRGNLPVGLVPDADILNGLGIAETIRSIERNGSWMVLKFVEQDEVYRNILDALLDEITPLVSPVTGMMLKREAFIFISSPNAITPFHFNPEHNILLQLRGTKTMSVFPASDESIVAGTEHERFHIGGHRNLPWHESMQNKGRAFDLAAGEAIYVPVKSPHWVQNGPGVSISLSITWRSEWSYMEADARGMNSVLRRFGMTPKAPKRFPNHNVAKSFSYRVIRRIRRHFTKN